MPIDLQNCCRQCSCTQSNREFATANYKRDGPDNYKLQKYYSDNQYDGYRRSSRNIDDFHRKQTDYDMTPRQRKDLNRDYNRYSNRDYNRGNDRDYNRESCRDRNCDSNRYRNCDNSYRNRNICYCNQQSKPKSRSCPTSKYCDEKDDNEQDECGVCPPCRCCTCKPCPFCLLRKFCKEVLYQLAELKAKEIGGTLEKLIYTPDLDKTKAGSEEKISGEFEGSKADRVERSSELSGSGRQKGSLSRDYSQDESRYRTRRRSDESNYRGGRRSRDFSDDRGGRRGRDYSDDDNGQGRRDSRRVGRDSYDSRTDRRGGRRGLDRRGERRGSDSNDGRGDEKRKNKKKKKEPPAPVEVIPEEVAKELEKTRAKAAKEKKTKEEVRAKKALIEQRLMQSTQLRCKNFAIKPYSGPGRFAEVGICDFMKLRLESLNVRPACPPCCPPICSPCCPSYCSPCFPKLCAPPCMPVVSSLVPSYCCPSFWCPPSRPAICCY